MIRSDKKRIILPCKCSYEPAELNVYASSFCICKEKLRVKSTTNANKYVLHTIRDDLLICIPTTFMNLSGRAVAALKSKYPTLTGKDILVVHDDLEHKLGNVRVKDGGSAQYIC